MNHLLGFVMVPDFINTTSLPHKHLSSSIFSFILFELDELLRLPSVAGELNLRKDMPGLAKKFLLSLGALDTGWGWTRLHLLGCGSNWGRWLPRVSTSWVNPYSNIQIHVDRGLGGGGFECHVGSYRNEASVKPRLGISVTRTASLMGTKLVSVCYGYNCQRFHLSWVHMVIYSLN